MAADIALNELPHASSPDYFRLLIRNCIETYKKLPNDVMCLDYNRVPGKLRAAILDDDEYKRETRNIYARQRLEELSEIDNVIKSAVYEETEKESEDPRERGRPPKKSGVVDKDMLNMRFKAAQMKRELISQMNEDNSSSERDAVAFMYVDLTREELDRDIYVEFHAGTAEADMEDLTDRKEEMPDGSGGKLRKAGQTRAAADEDFFDVLENGEIIER
jgi:hypothetical protein